MHNSVCFDITSSRKHPIIQRMFSELQQDAHLSYSIVKYILMSKRLLIDHIESLEICHTDLERIVHQPKVFTSVKAVVLGSAATFCQILEVPKIAKIATMCIGTSYGFGYLLKCARNLRNRMLKKRLETLVRSIDNFSNYIKKTITYFNEVQFIKANVKGDSLDEQHFRRAWSCIKSIKDVTKILFDATRKLEKEFPLKSCLIEFYYPMEDLYDCDYFIQDISKYEHRHIKDFFNIFSYVQSQFLLRLGLSITENPCVRVLREDIVQMTSFMHLVLEVEEKNYIKLANDSRQKQLPCTSKLQSITFGQKCFSPIAILKDTSLKLSSSIIAVAEECEMLDRLIQNIPEDSLEINTEAKKILIGMNERVRAIEVSLSICNDDFQRLGLLYNSYISNKTSSKSDKKCITAEENTENENQTSPITITEEYSHVQNDDEYFAYMLDDGVTIETDDHFKMNTEFTAANYEDNASKKRFKPVLDQLKHKINPIRQDMLEKEKRILQSKGIDIDKFFTKTDSYSELMLSDTESDDSSSVGQQHKTPRRDNFEEVREFLARKQPVNMFQLPMSSSRPIITEDILE